MSVESTAVSGSVDCLATAAHIRQELDVWNYDEATVLAAQVETALNSGASIENFLVPGVLILLARVHINRAETTQSDAARHLELAGALLGQAEKIVVADPERLLEIGALKASVENLTKGPDAALTLLEGRIDPYAVRIRAALLLNQQKPVEALRVIEGLEPHERWCDVAVTVYALNDAFEKAQEVVRWVAGLHDGSRLSQCIVKLSEALMAHALVDHTKGANVFPYEVTRKEREKLETIVETLRPVLQSIRMAGIPTSGLDIYALRIAWQANHLLQDRRTTGELLGLMNAWTPIPLDVARGAMSGYIEAPRDLPERLRRDHPGDLDANILAGVVQSACLGQNGEAFAKAKELVPLANSNTKKEELFKLFQQIWQNLEDSEAPECEAIANPLVAHNPRLHGIFDAAVLLRHGDADGAICALDREKAADDIYWLQLRSSALLQKQQIGEAVELLLVAAKKTCDAGLLHKTGDLAYQAKKFDVAVWCFEHLAKIQPANVALRSNLAHIYTVALHDLTKAAVQFRALRSAEPDNPAHTLNLAICLAQLFLPEESLSLYDELCRQQAPTIVTVIGRAQLHHSLGHPAYAFASLNAFRERFWDDPSFLLAYMSTAYAAGNEGAADEATKALNLLQVAGQIEKEMFRAIQQDEVVEMFKQSSKQTQDRNESIHAEMLKGRMPWVWAEQMSSNAIYWGWRTRTQEMGWIGDDPANRARLCIYSTNGFHARESESGRRSLLPLECPPAGTKVVVDLSALITLHRLGLLNAAAEYFGELLVPAGYLPTVLEDSRQMVLNQRARQKSAEQIRKKIDAECIVVLEEGAKSQIATVDEHTDTENHNYRLIDIVRPLSSAGIVNDAEFGRIFPVCAKKTAADETHPNLTHLQDVVVELSTLETLARFGLLDAVTGFYKVHVRTQAHREVLQRLAAIACQEETREWQIDLWTQLRGDPRFRFVPYTVQMEMRKKDDDPKDFLPFLASFIAQETKTALMADDRVCQAFTLNEAQDTAHAAFGTDALVLTLMATGKLDPVKVATIIRQLMAWRYRFLVPPPEVLKVLADQYRGNPPGQTLRDVSEYVHDCMRDPGLFGGQEKTELGESMATRYYLSWLTVIAEFLILVWADEGFTVEAATRLTEWSARELLPSVPRVLDGRMKVRMSSITPRIFLSHALVRTVAQSGNPRMADGIKALKEALRLNDDEYIQIAMGMLNDTDRTAPQS